MMSLSRLRRLAAVPALAVLGLLVAAPAPAGPGDPVEVSAVATFSPGIELYTDCDGVEHEFTYDEFGVLLERTGPLLAEITVGITYSGDLADNLADAPTEVTFESGSDYAEVLGTLDPVEEGTLTVTVEPGVAYTVGEGSIDIVVEPPVDAISCLDEITVFEDRVAQTIDVGERPKPYGFFDEDGDGVDTNIVGVYEVDGEQITYDESDYLGDYLTPVVGELPPGLTYAQDRWGGAATAPGTYAFSVRVCVADALPVDEGDDAADLRLADAVARAADDLPTVCFGTAEVSVEVLAAAADAPPAQPISTDAQFAG
jgi:hypothetical protein